MKISQRCFDRIDAQLGEAVLSVLQRSGEAATQDSIFMEVRPLIQSMGMPEGSIKAYLAMKIQEFSLQQEAAAVCTGE